MVLEIFSVILDIVEVVWKKLCKEGKGEVVKW